MSKDKYAKIKKAEDVGEETFEELKEKTVTIAGLGSLGSMLAEALTRAGINIRMIDMGRIETEDLATCSFFLPEEESKFKAKEGKNHITDINPKNTVKSFHEKLKDINTYLLDSDLVIDCTQDWETSKLINNYCKENKLPIIYTRYAGSEALILSRKNGYPHTKLEGKVEKFGSVEEDGLLPQTIHWAAAVVLNKVFKILKGEKYSDKLFKLDSWKGSKRESKL